MITKSFSFTNQQFQRSISAALLIFFAGITSLCAAAERTVIWTNDPITLVLPIGKEVRVTFPTDVVLQIPAGLSDKLSSMAPNQQMVYWTANEQMEKSRVIATSTDNETVYLLDLIANDSGVDEAIRLEDPARVSSNNSNQSAASEAASNNSQQADTQLSDPSEIVLTRFASQSLYAPRRLVPSNGEIQQAHAKIPNNFPLIKSENGEVFRYEVVGAWTGYGHYITAVMVVNESAISVRFNPGLVHGNFSHITAQHLNFGPKGTLEDRTTIYLISAAPFASALQEDSYGY